MLTSYSQMLLMEAIDNTITASFQKGEIFGNVKHFDYHLAELDRGVTEIQLQVGTLSKSGLVVIAPSRIFEVSRWVEEPTVSRTSLQLFQTIQPKSPAKLRKKLHRPLAQSLFFLPSLRLLFHFSLARSHSSSIDEAASMTKIRLVQIDRKNLATAWMAGHLQAASHKLNTTRDVIQLAVRGRRETTRKRKAPWGETNRS